MGKYLFKIKRKWENKASRARALLEAVGEHKEKVRTFVGRK
jgi:hypothetical protein